MVKFPVQLRLWPFAPNEQKDLREALTPLIEKGFFVDASNMLAERKQSATPETEGEGRREARPHKQEENYPKRVFLLPQPEEPLSSASQRVRHLTVRLTHSLQHCLRARSRVSLNRAAEPKPRPKGSAQPAGLIPQAHRRRSQRLPSPPPTKRQRARTNPRAPRIQTPMTDNPLPQPRTSLRNISWYLPRGYAAKLLFVFQQMRCSIIRELPMATKRRRKLGPRHKNGHLKRMPIEDSPRTIAARMPHRKGIGPDPDVLDHRYESELGRMVLREERGRAGDRGRDLRAAMAWLRGHAAGTAVAWPWCGRAAVQRLRATRNAGTACAACASGSTSRRPTCCFTPGVERRLSCRAWQFTIGRARAGVYRCLNGGYRRLLTILV